MKIAIVTFEFEGLTKNGGIGTAYKRLTEVLIRDGHEVTVVFMPFDWDVKFSSDRKNISRELRKLKKDGVRVAMPEFELSYEEVSNKGFHHRRSLLVYEFLRKEKFDVVHAPDNCGLPYYSLLARKSGLAFDKTSFVIGLHGPPIWTAEASGTFSEFSVGLSLLDRYSVEMSDYAVGPSAYMVSYLRNRGWKLPSKTRVIANANKLAEYELPTQKAATKSQTSGAAPASPKSLVFFGRLERRKGIYLFVEAIHRLLENSPEFTEENPLNVVFLGGEPMSQNQQSPSAYIELQFSYHRGRVRAEFLKNFSSEQSLNYLRTAENHLVCMPSLSDNSPYVIVEAIEAGLDFVASANGGQSELINQEDGRVVLCEPNISSLAKALRDRLMAAPVKVRPSKGAIMANSLWRDFHRSLKKADPPSKSKATPRISVIVGAHPGQPAAEPRETLKSVFAQDYVNLEIVLADDLAPHPKSRSKTRVRTKRFDPNVDNPRLAALEQCTGKYVLFLDGGQLIHRSTLRRWIQGALTISEGGSRFGAHHGLVQNHVHTAKGSYLERVVAKPGERSAAMTYFLMGSSFSLWDREFLNSVKNSVELNLSNDSTSRVLYSHLIAADYRISSIPLDVVRSFPSRTEPPTFTLDQTTTVLPFGDGRAELFELYAALAGMTEALGVARETQYQMSRRISELEQMKSEIRKCLR